VVHVALPDGKALTLPVGADTTAMELKRLVLTAGRTPRELLKSAKNTSLTFRGKVLKDGSTMGEHGIVTAALRSDAEGSGSSGSGGRSGREVGVEEEFTLFANPILPAHEASEDDIDDVVDGVGGGGGGGGSSAERHTAVEGDEGGAARGGSEKPKEAYSVAEAIRVSAIASSSAAAATAAAAAAGASASGGAGGDGGGLFLLVVCFCCGVACQLN
jgi:hypothetical protein